MIKYSEVQPGMKLYVVTVENTTYVGMNGSPVIEVTVKSKGTSCPERAQGWHNPLINHTVRLVGTSAYLFASRCAPEVPTDNVEDPELSYIPKRGMPGFSGRICTDKAEAHKLAAKLLRQKAGTVKRKIGGIRTNIEMYAASLREYEKMLSDIEEASEDLASK